MDSDFILTEKKTPRKDYFPRRKSNPSYLWLKEHLQSTVLAAVTQDQTTALTGNHRGTAEVLSSL